jgi:hypothetical protein
MPWFTAALGATLVAVGIWDWSPTDWAFIIGAVATAVVSVFGGIKAMRTNNTPPADIALTIAKAVIDSIDKSHLPTTPQQIEDLTKTISDQVAQKMSPPAGPPANK